MLKRHPHVVDIGPGSFENQHFGFADSAFGGVAENIVVQDLGEGIESDFFGERPVYGVGNLPGGKLGNPDAADIHIAGGDGAPYFIVAVSGAKTVQIFLQNSAKPLIPKVYGRSQGDIMIIDELIGLVGQALRLGEFDIGVADIHTDGYFFLETGAPGLHRTFACFRTGRVLLSGVAVSFFNVRCE